MEGKQSLKEKLKIQDFVCRGSAIIVIDLVESYYMTAYSLQNKLSSGMADKIKSQGLDLEALKEILDTDETLLGDIFKANSDSLMDVDDSVMPQDYVDLKTKIESVKINLDSSTLSVEAKQELEKEIADGQQALMEIKRVHIQNSLASNPEKLLSNPKALKAMINLITSKTKVEKIESDPDKVLFNIQNSIIEEFVLGKVKEHEILNIEPPAKILFSKSDFYDLLVGISEEKENLMKQESLDFFLNMRNSKS
jgi:hypothetical protein